jgi:hypothetical protein
MIIKRARCIEAGARADFAIAPNIFVENVSYFSRSNA